MSYSVILDQTTDLKNFQLQPFSKERWERYPFASREQLQWFRENKFGLFLHVGINSLGMVDIGWTRHSHVIPDPGEGEIPDEIYDGWAKQFTFESFCAKEWAQLAVDGGMRYVVIITKHHDGFHMWDTKYSSYKVTNTPFGRDYLGELIQAFREAGLKIGLYYSQRDWTHPDYQPIDPQQVNLLDHMPFFEMKDQKPYTVPEKHKKYIEYMHNTVLELMSKYGKIDVLWWDADYCGGMYLEEMWDSESLIHKVKELQPDILINNRAGCPGDFDTPEGFVGLFQNTRCWETCMPLGPIWSYNGENPKPLKTILEYLVGCICGDGNFLLSIGAMPQGELADTDAQRIRQIGQWLKKYGESIYNTRGGPWKPGEWGGSCYRKNTVYLHVLDGEKIKECLFQLPHNRIVHAQSLTGEKIRFRRTPEGVRFAVEQECFESEYCIIQLTLEEPVNPDEIPLSYQAAEKKASKEGDVSTSQAQIVEFSEREYVTRCRLTPQNQAKVQIEISQDGSQWEPIYSENLSRTEDVTVTRYEAGAYICGRVCKWMKITATGKVHYEIFTQAKE